MTIKNPSDSNKNLSIITIIIDTQHEVDIKMGPRFS